MNCQLQATLADSSRIDRTILQNKTASVEHGSLAEENERLKGQLTAVQQLFDAQKDVSSRLIRQLEETITRWVVGGFHHQTQ